MKTRIKKVRKHFKLTMENFGERINLTKSMISLIESGKHQPTNRTISAICREFKIDEQWLRKGGNDGNILFQQDNKSLVDRLSEEYQLTHKEQAILTAFLKLDSSERSVITKYINNIIAELTETPIDPQADQESEQAAEPSALNDIIAQTDQESENAMLRRELQEMRQENQKMSVELAAIKRKDETHKMLDEQLDLEERGESQASSAQEFDAG